jgi:imidazolonepropionase-like amidohydrolase
VDVIAHTPFVELPDALLLKAVRQKTIFVSTVALWNDPRLISVAARNLVRYVALGGRIAIGTDYPNFPRRGLLEELRILSKAGIPAARIVQALTRDGAAAIGRESEIGTIAPGMLADLVVVDGNPMKSVEVLSKVVLVMRGGERIR